MATSPTELLAQNQIPPTDIVDVQEDERLRIKVVTREKHGKRGPFLEIQTSREYSFEEDGEPTTRVSNRYGPREARALYELLGEALRFQDQQKEA